MPGDAWSGKTMGFLNFAWPRRTRLPFNHSRSYLDLKRLPDHPESASTVCLMWQRGRGHSFLSRVQSAQKILSTENDTRGYVEVSATKNVLLAMATPGNYISARETVLDPYNDRSQHPLKLHI